MISEVISSDMFTSGTRTIPCSSARGLLGSEITWPSGLPNTNCWMRAPPPGALSTMRRRAWKAFSLVRVLLLALAMLSAVASTQALYVPMPDWAMPMAENMLMLGSDPGDGRAKEAVLVVQGVDGQLMAQLGLGALGHLLVDVHVVA